MAEWKISTPALPEYLAALRDLPPLTAQILCVCAEAAYKFISGIPDPVDLFTFADAVARILTAVGHDEPIAVYADYDCDSTTASALLVRTLIRRATSLTTSKKANVQALDNLTAQGVGLVITVDCGVRAHRESQHARSLGLDLIVTDHHELDADSLPDAFAVIGSKRPDCPYQFAHLAGMEVAFRLAQRLLRTARGWLTHQQRDRGFAA